MKPLAFYLPRPLITLLVLLFSFPLSAAEPYLKKWSVVLNEKDSVGVESAPAVDASRVFVADDQGVLHCLSLDNGKTLWQHKADVGYAAGPFLADGKIFIGDLSGTFRCLTADAGKILWSLDTDAPIHGAPSSVGDDLILANDAGLILRITKSEGKTVWKTQLEDRVNAAAGLSKTHAYLAGCDSKLHCLDLATGKETWSFDLGGVGPASPVPFDDQIIVGADQGRLLCVNADGKTLKWLYEGFVDKAMVYSTPTVAQGIVLAGARDRQLHAVDLKDGKPLWTFRSRGDFDANPLVKNGKVYAPSTDKKLYVLSLKTGQELWSFQSPRPLNAGVAFHDNLLILADMSGNVACLQLPD